MKMGCIQDLSAHPFRAHEVLQCQEWLHSRNGHAELGIAVKPLILQVFGAMWECTASPAQEQQHTRNQRTPQTDIATESYLQPELVLRQKYTRLDGAIKLCMIERINENKRKF